MEKTVKYIIIGGVAAGMSAASKIKRMDASAEVTVYEKGAYLSYGACGLAYYVADYNDDHTRMIARTREAFEKAGIKTFLNHEAIAVDSFAKTLTVKDVKSGATLQDRYDKLLIATGASAVKPPIPGIEKRGVYTLKTMEDGLGLKEAVSAYGVHEVVVIGGGYIGVEVAEAMRARKKQVTLIEAMPSILAQFDSEIVSLAERELKANGVDVKKGERVEEFSGTSLNAVRTDKGSYTADIAVVAAGVKPNTAFLAGTGVALAPNGAVIVDRQLRTNVADIYAAGDCAVVYNRLKNRDDYIPLGTYANKCGRLAGGNMLGRGDEFTGALGSSALKVFGLELGRTGLTEAEALELACNAAAVTVNTTNHPAYYPGQTELTIKLVYDKNNYRILGAQLAGREGAALRTDIFATAIQGGMTTKELGMTDLIYSPPWAGVWDAVHIACNAAK